MLTRADFGLHLTGRVDSLSEVVHRSGVKNDKPWAFYQQTMTMAVGGEMFEVNYTADAQPDGPLCPFELDQVCRVKVGSPRTFNLKTSFDAKG